MKRLSSLAAIALLALVGIKCSYTTSAVVEQSARVAPIFEWPDYGNDAGGSRYSPLSQINRDNVRTLKVAWTYATGDVSRGSRTMEKTSFEATPIEVDGALYMITPVDRVVSLDAQTGIERWFYDPKVDTTLHYSSGFTSRGVSTWLDSERNPDKPCRRRIFAGTLDGRLIALDAAKGTLCGDFGGSGIIDLKLDVGNPQPGEYEIISPPAIVGDLVVVGSAVSNEQRVNAPDGMVRALDARTGAVRWRFHPVPRNPIDPAWKTWEAGGVVRSGAAGTRAIISADLERGLVFLATSNSSPAYFGGTRLGNNEYADSIVALRAKTGEVAWLFQTVHHNLWDYDPPTQPILTTIRKDGRDHPAVIAGTRSGFVFALDRETGKPIYPVVERAVPQSDVLGERTSPTQPFSSLPAMVPQSLTADQAYGVTPIDQEYCRDRIARLRNEGLFTPPSLGGSLEFPGRLGGMNWSGAAFDPVHQLLFANTNRVATEIRLIPRDEYDHAAADGSAGTDFSPQIGAAYGASRRQIVSPVGLPCNPPPWGALTALDLSTGTIKWTVPLGSMLPPVMGESTWGSLNLGGAIATASGLVFIGATDDPHLRAFDAESGQLLWIGDLPASGTATPMTYQLGSNGKQYVVIAAGGNSRISSKLGDSVVAFTLP